MRGRRLAYAMAFATACACRGGPSDEEIDQLRAEAQAANAEAIAKAPTTNDPGFSLAVSGQIDQPPATLGWSEIQKLATTTIETPNPQTPHRAEDTEFRGIRVADLLTRFGAREEATEATVVSTDGFRATFILDDARKFPLLLAIEMDGQPIPRSAGGPIYMVYPIAEKEMKWRYPDRFWAFYVTHLVVGTEAPLLTVRAAGNEYKLNADGLDQVDHATKNQPVSWKVEWSSGDVHIRGVKLPAVFDALNIKVADGSKILVRGKSPLHRDPARPVLIDSNDFDRCKPLLAMQYGPTEQPIPARLGGPILLAFEAKCADRYPESKWVTFVEELEVIPPETGAP